MTRLLVVSNRLPVTVKKEDGKWTYQMSSGGLVTALNGLKQEMTFTWIGFGFNINKDGRALNVPPKSRLKLLET